MNGRIDINAQIAGINFIGALAPSGGRFVGQDGDALPAAKAGTLSTRTDNTSGVLALASGHGVQLGDTIDVYWVGGMRYGAVVDSVIGTAVTFGVNTPGAGDNLPVQGTAIAAAIVTEITPPAFDGDELVALAAVASRRCHLHFKSAGGSILALELAANAPWFWLAADPAHVNPFTGDPIVQVLASNGDSAGTATVRFAGLLT